MSARPIRIAVQISPQHADYEAIRATVLEVEQLGADIVFNWDHFFPLSGDPEGRHFEAWTMLAAWAEETSRIELGPLVNCNSFRNPDLQADMARTVDRISAKGGTGRLIFGTGAGWFERDYADYGYEYGTPGTRLDALARDLPRIRARWARLNPPPSRDIPILIGGGGERKTLRIVAEHATIWHSFARGEELARKLDVLRAHCEAVGRDVREIELSTGKPPHRGAELTPADLDAARALGFTLFTIGVDGPEHDLAPVKAALAWRESVS
jgi:probable F420-dependent oxidoreductase